ncbi:hypothetical protein BUALT_Bualt18G0130200 [Buddleja alternifolia]|uniref:4-coumarate--CoA ligase n=1 Tax=Buddleja alternifolia TaxID=168488 RepID=A0AAV6WAZ1_9LAMI|nr:hypothetical protein BUALT_Bualt18G0130200 [Buddleja alternifolia]
MANYSEAHICQCLSRLASVRRNSAVTINGDRRKTGMQFVDAVIGLAHGLLRLGINPGDVVSISAFNSDLYLEWMLAITYVGGIAAPLNYRWSLEEAKSAMEVAQPVLLVTDSSHGYWHSKFRIDIVPSLQWHVLMDAPIGGNKAETIFDTELLKKPKGTSITLDYLWAPERAAIICFTSGTTGRPKGVTIGHSALVVQSLAKIAIVRYDEDDVYLHTAPLCHIGGISSAMAVLMAGGCHVIIPKFEANIAIEAIREHNVTSLIIVPTMMADLISFNRMKQKPENFESLKKILNGGGGLSVELIKGATKFFPRAILISAYGMTEACSSLTFKTLYDPTNESHFQHSYDVKKTNLSCQEGVCVGKPAPHVELRVSAEEASNSGRILMRGPHVMLHYWGQSPSKHMDPVYEGWFDTGDIGQIDDQGNLWLVGRAKDRIKSGGENIYPGEVEGVLSQHPGLSRTVVIGVPDSRLTETVIACIQLKDGWRWDDFGSNHSADDNVEYLSSEILRHFCREENLTGFKIPKRYVLWRNAFPMTTTGKIRREQVGVCVMESQEVLENGGSSNGGVIVSNGGGLEQVTGENGLEGHVGGDAKGNENSAEEVLEGLEEYWEDINDRLMISRMVSDSVIKGMVTAVEQEAAEKIATKELELATLKECLKSDEVGPGKYEAVRLVSKGYEVGNYGRLSSFTDACVKHEKMREDLHSLRSLAIEQFEKAKNEIECAKGYKSMKKIGSGSELAGLGGILEEKQSESLMHVDKMLEYHKTTMDTVCTKVDDILQSSEVSLCELQQERDLSSKLEDIVIQSVLRSRHEEFEEKLWEQNAQLCGLGNVNWIEKFKDISSLGTQLDAILKSLSIPETGLVSHGSHDLDHVHHKAFSNHVTPLTAPCKENGTLEASCCTYEVPENYDFPQLKHMTKEQLVIYFNGIITKMRRDHESAVQQKTEEYFCLKREYLKEMGSLVKHRKDEEHDVLRKKIPEVISKLDDFLLENKSLPALTNNLESMGKMKDRIENLLSENRQLRDCLTDKKNEVRCLEAQVSGTSAKSLQHPLAEENTPKLVANLKLAVEDSCIEASIGEEVYKCAPKELIGQRRDSEDTDMEFLLMRENYDIILKEAAIPAETPSKYEIEDSDVESFIMHGLSGLIFKEAIKDAEEKLIDLYRDVLAEKENRICLERKALEKESELRLEVEEREKLKQEILVLGTEMEQKEMLVMDLSVSLSKEKEQLKLVSQELTSLREQASQQQRLVTERNESLTAQLVEAMEQIEVDKTEMQKLKQKLDQTEEVLAEANKDRNVACVRAQEMHDKFLSSEAREEKLKKELETAISSVCGLSKMFNNFECRVSQAIEMNTSRLEDTSSHLKDLAEMANALKQTELTYKQKLERRCADLHMAEAEVDLLGDEVDTQLRLLERIYIALDHYSPILKHYPGIMEILELVRRELTGESTKLA